MSAISSYKNCGQFIHSNRKLIQLLMAYSGFLLFQLLLIICILGGIYPFRQNFNIGIKLLIIFFCNSENLSCLQLHSLCVNTLRHVCIHVYVHVHLREHSCRCTRVLCVFVYVCLCTGVYRYAYTLFLDYSCQQLVRFIKLSDSAVISLFSVLSMSTLY